MTRKHSSQKDGWIRLQWRHSHSFHSTPVLVTASDNISLSSKRESSWTRSWRHSSSTRIRPTRWCSTTPSSSNQLNHSASTSRSKTCHSSTHLEQLQTRRYVQDRPAINISPYPPPKQKGSLCLCTSHPNQFHCHSFYQWFLSFILINNCMAARTLITSFSCGWLVSPSFLTFWKAEFLGAFDVAIPTGPFIVFVILLADVAVFSGFLLSSHPLIAPLRITRVVLIHEHLTVCMMGRLKG